MIATTHGSADPGPVLEVDSVSKSFGPLRANDSISLTLGRGEVLALLGENGAGKSTLVSMLFGHYVPDSGRIHAFGQPLPPGDTRAALAAGIGMVHQHFTLADNLSVLDNVLVGQEPLTRWSSSRSAVRAKLLDSAAAYGLEVDPDARVGDLSVGEKQRVEILKALVRGAKILILDEPTAVLTPQESESLFDTLARFVAGGLSMIFISHKLDEVLRVSDRVMVLRAGRMVTEVRSSEATTASLARAMIGRELEAAPGVRAAPILSGGHDAPPLTPILSLTGVRVGPVVLPQLSDVDFEVFPGEVFAVAGVAGNGQQALADLLCGIRSADAGEVRVANRPMPAVARQWIDAGVARIPEDRVEQGVIGDASLDENAIIETYRRPASLRGGALGRWLGLLDRRQMRDHAQRIADGFDVRHAGLGRPIRSLSGGNIQKFILGRELGRQPSLIIANQPTWGLDVGAVRYVHDQLLDARQRGAAIVLISEELDEIFALADRVAVIFKGRLGAPRPVAEWTPQVIGLAMAGQTTPTPTPAPAAVVPTQAPH